MISMGCQKCALATSRPLSFLAEVSCGPWVDGSGTRSEATVCSCCSWPAWRVALGCRETPCASTGGSALFLAMGMMAWEMEPFFSSCRSDSRTRWDSHRIGRCGWRLGGFFLPFLLGAIKQRTGSIQEGFFFSQVLSLRLPDLVAARYQMARNWQEESADRAGIFSYRSFSELRMEKRGMMRARSTEFFLGELLTSGKLCRGRDGGNGWRVLLASEQILACPQDLKITIFGEETHVNYTAILLSSCACRGESGGMKYPLMVLSGIQKHGIEFAPRRSHYRR